MYFGGNRRENLQKVVYKSVCVCVFAVFSVGSRPRKAMDKSKELKVSLRRDYYGLVWCSFPLQDTFDCDFTMLQFSFLLYTQGEPHHQDFPY